MKLITFPLNGKKGKNPSVVNYNPNKPSTQLLSEAFRALAEQQERTVKKYSAR